ncbi:pyruvate decarboxylase [Amniculicola lignicola CBS 123094]|uniref:Pyruvate decarboxylase n=1 Tax=Amniculicola lignicola CBS 123094 TaxID=1392246 RepID=A0A6A5W1E5_9PLEO|nr:pyruvate decarboxylase [Amniculicola lignicola CBS 123094]
MSKTVNVAQYLFTRLHQLGVRSVHGVPGDYTIRALDFVKPAGLQWIGNCNELNAGYAADGYARVKGISALFTTYGVGELSTINAVAGSYAEYAPVIHIVGTPKRSAYISNVVVHHSLGDGNLRVMAEIYKKFTCAQASLFKPENAPELIDAALEHCVKESRPVYIELPSDVVGARVSAHRLHTPLNTSTPSNIAIEEKEIVDVVLERLYSAKQPFILVDGLTAADGIVDEVNEFVRPFGTLDFTDYTESADLALVFSPLFSDTNTQGWSAVPRKEISIVFHRNHLEIGETRTHKLGNKSLIQALLNHLDFTKVRSQSPKATALPSIRGLAKSLAPPNPEAPIDQDTFYLRISSFFRPKDIIICANGTPLAGSRDFVLPPDTKLIASSIWLSVGHMLPATQGASLAQHELGTGGRTILFEGDGSFQATAQELSTIIRYKLDVTIFLISNDGYTFERLIHGPEEEYNDIARWNYLLAPEIFGAPKCGSYEVETHDVGTWGELQSVLDSEKFQNGKGLKMVNVRMGRLDINTKFKEALKLAGQQLM